MKTSLLFLSLLALTTALATGCTKSQDYKKELDQKLAEIKRQHDIKTKEIILSPLLTDGGQPGTITLNGATVIDVDKLDSRITVSQEAGLNLSGSATTTAKDLKKLNTLDAEKLENLKASLKKHEDEKSYINLGCELAESEIAGLTDASDKITSTKASESLTASRIFICGEQNFNKLSVHISASEITLKDTSIIIQKNLGNLSLNTGTLALVGKNKITSLGEDYSGYVLSGASVDLTVTNEILSDGELAITSKGGNNIAEQKKASN